jgi:hypothetical protein
MYLSSKPCQIGQLGLLAFRWIPSPVQKVGSLAEEVANLSSRILRTYGLCTSEARARGARAERPRSRVTQANYELVQLALVKLCYCMSTTIARNR